MLINRLEREKKTVEAMVTLYCKTNHNKGFSPCDRCKKLISYAFKRVDNCKFGHKKPICGRCKIHCYNPDMRGEIKAVMIKTGPKMLLLHPFMTLYHLLDSIIYK